MEYVHIRQHIKDTPHAIDYILIHLSIVANFHHQNVGFLPIRTLG